MIKRLICRLFGHKYGEVYEVYEWSHWYIARDCSRCGHTVRQDKQTIREVFFGIFEDED